MLYPFGLHRLPAPAPPEPQHWTRERLDTPRQHQSGRSTSPKAETDGERHGDSTSGRAAPEIKLRSGTPEEPEPDDSSSGDKTASRQPAPPEPQRSSQSQKSQKRGTVDHERRRTETERRRAEKERERRENDSKTPLFSPSHRTPSRSTASTSPAPADTDSRRNAAFFGSAFVEYAELTEINVSFDHTKDGGRFTFSRLQQRQKFGFVPSSPRLYLFHQTPSLKHTVHQRHIPLQT